MSSKSEQFSVFVPLLKVDEEQRLVYGVMAEEVLDNSGEIFDYDSSKPNFEKWSEETYNTSNGMSKGNLRVMHGSVAAGKLTDISFDDGSKRIECCAKVVDDNEWKKVIEGVYTGFSIGGRYEKRWMDKAADGSKATRYTAKPVEVSLVDKPCIPTATFQMIKKDGMVEDRLFKTVIGDDTMTDFAPTNDQLLAKATELAKAAGHPESDWLAFADEARQALADEHLGKAAKKKENKPLVDEERDEALDGEAGSDEESDDAAEKAEGEIDESAPAKTSKEEEEEEEEGTAAKADEVEKSGKVNRHPKGSSKGGQFASGGGSGVPAGISPEGEKQITAYLDAIRGLNIPDDVVSTSVNAIAAAFPKSAGKSDMPENQDLKQVWQTSDGQTFIKKADAVAHEKTIGEEPSLTDMIKAAQAKLSADPEIAKSEVAGDQAEEYPLDSPEQIRASYAKAVYAADEPAIKRIAKAWKLDINPDGPPSVEAMLALSDLSKLHSMVTSDDYVAKGMWEVSRMADVMNSVASIQSCLAYEARAEGDSSPIPAKLKTAAASLATIMVELVSEEVGELIARMGENESSSNEPAPLMALAASTLGLEKADVDSLAKSMVAGKAVYRIQKMHDHTVALGAMCKKAEEKEETGEAEKMAKFDSVSQENELLKTNLAKANGEISEAKEMIKALAADIEKIKAMPMPSAPRTHVVDKSGDIEKTEQPLDLSKMSKEQLADLAIRMAQANGNKLLGR